MLNILYTIFIFPIEQIIELVFVVIYHRIVDNPAYAIFGVSLFVSTITLPLYFMAERIQHSERDIQKRMKADVDNIKAVFKGDERYMRLSTYYRQNGYHPLYSLRSSVSLIIQIPFFIAAYNFLVNLNLLNYQSFLFIKNLSAPDGLLMGINILPVLMTLINIVSTIIYSKYLLLKDKIQLYGIAVIFLILLYNASAALVLYWTCNNLYSLIKNIFINSNNKKTLFNVLVYFTGGISFIHRLIKNIRNTSLEYTNKTFFLSLIGLFLLIGLFNPSSLIASSVEEFSYLSQHASPVAYVGIVVLQSIGIAFWFICIFFLFNKNIKTIFSLLITIILGVSLFNSILFSNQYEHMLPDLTFANFTNLPLKQDLINLLFAVIICIVLTILFFNKRKIVLFSLQIVLVGSLFFLGLINLFNINNDFKNVQPSFSTEFEEQYTFSRTGKNVLVIILDRGVSGYIPVIFREKPELLNSYNGFTYYPNTVSSGRSSLHGLPPTFGGYYYSVHEIQKRKDELQWSKIRQATQILPRILAKEGFHVKGDNLPYIRPSVFDDIDNITTENKMGSYSELFKATYGLNTVDDYNYNYYIFFKNFIRYSFLKAFPTIFHEKLYNEGNYLSIYNSNSNLRYSKKFIDYYSSLFYLPNTTSINDINQNYASIFVNELTHNAGYLQVPEYFPSINITNRGDGPFYGSGHFPDEGYYHSNMASFILLARWFDFLKENGVYNNTRIIIASDHGSHYIKTVPNDIKLPNNRSLRYFNSILLVKDFDEDFAFKTDNTFMTNADVPHLAAQDLVSVLINPFTGEELKIDKENGFYVTTNMDQRARSMNRYTYNIRPDEWLHVHTNIFDPDNWKRVNIE